MNHLFNSYCCFYIVAFIFSLLVFNGFILTTSSIHFLHTMQKSRCAMKLWILNMSLKSVVSVHSLFYASSCGGDGEAVMVESFLAKS